MARIQLVLSDGDRDRYVYQAKREGKTLSAWLREAAQEKLDQEERHRQFRTVEELREFFRACDEASSFEGPEPDWQEQKELISQSKSRGAAPT